MFRSTSKGFSLRGLPANAYSSPVRLRSRGRQSCIPILSTQHAQRCSRVSQDKAFTRVACTLARLPCYASAEMACGWVPPDGGDPLATRRTMKQRRRHRFIHRRASRGGNSNASPLFLSHQTPPRSRSRPRSPNVVHPAAQVGRHPQTHPRPPADRDRSDQVSLVSLPRLPAVVIDLSTDHPPSRALD